jgi:hypothetical protein
LAFAITAPTNSWRYQPAAIVGPFEEEEEGTGVASDIVKVEDEDLATPGYDLRSVDTRKPRDRSDSPILG